MELNFSVIILFFIVIYYRDGNEIQISQHVYAVIYSKPPARGEGHRGGISEGQGSWEVCV